MKVEYVDHFGDDLRVVNAARVSFDKESEWDWTNTVIVDDYEYAALQAKDAKLIRYLATHGHWTPFSHPQITVRETVPIFIARQRFKHMVGFTYSEVSRRYVDDEPEFYIPDVWRSRPEGSVKQGSGVKTLKMVPSLGHLKIFPFAHDKGKRYSLSKDYKIYLEVAERMYKHLLEGGVAPEQARMVLPQSMYTSYYVTGSLAAFARAYKQRADSHAQKEIQDLAAEWDRIIRPLFPVSWAALTETQ